MKYSLVGVGAAWILVFLTGCTSLNQAAVDSVAEVLGSPGGGTVFTGDDDPQLVAEALPFALKMYESVEAAAPNHPNLDTTLGSLYIMYASAFVAGPADYWGPERFAEKQQAQKRALKFYARGLSYLWKAIDLRRPGFSAAFRDIDTQTFRQALARFEKSDVRGLYWLSAGYLASFSLEPMNVARSAPVPRVIEILKRVEQLDPDLQGAALDELLVSVYASLPPDLGGDLKLASAYFESALRKTHGQSSGAYMAWATAVDLPGQKKSEFVDMMNKILSLDASPNRESTLPTLLNQERARWYLGQIDDLFLD